MIECLRVEGTVISRDDQARTGRNFIFISERIFHLVFQLSAPRKFDCGLELGTEIFLEGIEFRAQVATEEVKIFASRKNIASCVHGISFAIV